MDRELDAHLVLTGLPGSGKSTVGQLVAARLGWPFLDFDVEIERREGLGVPQLFAERGEAGFRALEAGLTRELAAAGGMVLAPGGGWIADPANVALLRPPACIVYLRVTPETALRRMGEQRATRPLLQHPDPIANLRALLARRAAAYEAADHVVDAEVVDIQRLVEIVAKLAPSNRLR